MLPLWSKTWQTIHGLALSLSRPPSPSIDPTLCSTGTDSGTKVKPIEQHTDTSAESDPQTQTTDAVDQQPDDDTESTTGKIRPLLHLFALIIGINEYESSSIGNLSGAVPDADAVRDYLQTTLGVPSSQIRNLRDDQATRTAIINEINGLSLNDDIKERDPIMIYFAGHGGAADMPVGWEAGGTKIQLLIPCDCSDVDDQKHGIPDRTLGALLSRLAGKKGDNITVILDCCHSASGTRDPTQLVRGIGVVKLDVPSDLDRDIWGEFESSNGSARGQAVSAGFTYGGLRSHVLMAACGSEEIAVEQKSRGLFTKGLLEALTTHEIDKFTYKGLLQRIPHLPSWQNPHCEGVNQDRTIFNAKALGKSTTYYEIREEGGRYVMPVGTAHGIIAGAEFEVYQDEDSGRLLGTVVAKQLSAFSTTLDVKESTGRFVLEGAGVALQTCVGTEEVLRIHVEDEELKVLVGQIETTDASQRNIELVDRDQAEFGMAFENGKVVFKILDSVVANYGLTRMPFILEPTLDDISLIIRAADHFYWHLRRTEDKTQRGLANYVEIEVAELEHDGDKYDKHLQPIYRPTVWKRGKDFHLQIKDEGTVYVWKIINKCKEALYPALFYFDNSDWSITSFYEPPTARGIVDPPLKGSRSLPVGYGDAGSVPYAFSLPEGQDLDVGSLKLFVSRQQVDWSHIAQSSPFASIGGRGCTKKNPSTTHLPWDTIVVPVVQRRASK